MTNFRHLEYACKVRHAGSMSAAARELGITQQALSKTVNALEHELGVRLFARDQGGVVPTENGMVLLDDAERILHAYQMLCDTAQNMRGTGERITRIGIPEGFIGGDNTPVPAEGLLRFIDRHPDTRYRFGEMPSDEVEQRVRAGTLDGGLTYHRPSQGCESLQLVHEALKAVVVRSDPLAEERLLTWNDLRGRKIMCMAQQPAAGHAITDYCHACGYTPDFIPPPSRFDASIAFVRANRAVFLTHDEKRVREAGDDLVMIPFMTNCRVEVMLYFIWNRAQVMYPELEEARDFFRGLVLREPPTD